MSKLLEASRVQLLNKSKASKKGMVRFKRRLKSKVANSVKQYNSINMDKLFKDGILTVDINVQGETDNYIVKISFGGFLDLLHTQLKQDNNKLDLRTITRVLINGFNKDDVYIHCDCPDWQYRFGYFATKNKINSGTVENRPSNITNPQDSLGSACKHVLVVLSNNSWILKVASTVYNYIRYMEAHYKSLYASIIFPAIYEKEYNADYQMGMFDNDNKLDADKDVLDTSNKYGKTRTQFKKDNPYRMTPTQNVKDQMSIDDDTQQ